MQLKIFIAFLLICFSLPSLAQEASSDIQKITLPNNERIKSYKMSPEGKHLIFNSLLDGKTKIFSANNNQIRELPAGAALNSVAFSKDEKRAFIAINQELTILDLPGGKTETLTKESFQSSKRWLWWYRIWNSNKAEMLEMNWKALEAGTAKLPAVTLKDGKISIIREDGSGEIDPLENRYYLYPSLSPDGTKICGVAYGKGSFVCNLDEKVLFGPEKLESPAWISDNMIVGVNTTDNGLNIKSSVLKLLNIDSGETEKISAGDLVALYPQFVKTKNEIYFQTPDGELYSVKYKHIK